MDAGLAKTLNSSVGTSALKALDTILKTDNTTIANNAVDRLFNNLVASSKLVGSDDVMYVYSGTWTSDNSKEYKTSYFIQFDKSGSVTIKTTQNASSFSMGDRALYVYDSNGTTIAQAGATLSEGMTVELSCSINVTAGSKYKFSVYDKNGYANHNVRVCGKTIMFAPTITPTT